MYYRAVRIEGIGVESEVVGKMVQQVLNQPYVIVGIYTSELYPDIGENLVIGKIGAEV